MRYLLLLFALSLGAALSFSLISSRSSDYHTIADTSSLYLDGLSFTQENQTIQKIRLNNGLEALLVSDPSLNSAGAALSLSTGSWDAPKDRAGLPHFIEHMLFLGSERYPNELEFSQFIDQHGGQKNAYTSDLFTSYFFTIDASVLDEALDRFGELFRAPLFNAASLERERIAIDQEHAKNRANDSKRAFFVQKQLSSENHPHHIFTTGNAKTLAAISAEELKNWWKTHYSAKNMRLIVYAPQPLDLLAKTVSAAFGDIPSPMPVKESIPLSPFTENLNKKIVYIEPTKSIMQLQVHWQLPKEFTGAFAGNAELAALLSAPQSGSLTDILEREGLAYRVVAESSPLGTQECDFSLEISLTDTGVRKIHAVITRVFQTLAFYKQNIVSQEVLASLQRQAQLQMRYDTANSDLLDQLLDKASNLSFEAMEHFPAIATQPYQSQAAAVQTLAKALTIERSHYLLLAPSEVSKVATTEAEQWLGARYTVKPICQWLLNNGDSLQPHAALTAPQPNPYLPSENALLLQYSDDKSHNGELLIDNEMMKIFWQNDNKLGMPKEVWQFEISSHLLNKNDATTSVLADLYVDVVQSTLNAKMTLAHSAGNDQAFRHNGDRFCLRVTAYSSIAQQLVEEILLTLNHSTLSPTQFQQIQHNLLTKYNYSTTGSSLSHSLYTYSLLTRTTGPTLEQKKAALMNINYEEFLAFEKELFYKLHIEGSIYGNVTRQAIITFIEKLPLLLPGEPDSGYDEQAYESDNNFISTWDNDDATVSAPLYVWSRATTVGNALLLTIGEPMEFSDNSSYAQLEVAMRAIQPHYFAALRTQQQTAYLVDSTTMRTGQDEVVGSFLIQSDSYNPEELLERTEHFLTDFLQNISEGKAFTQEEFESIRGFK